ncbi:DUF222 domain-containing protein [Janibacter melonis]|uniref:DUF222 domain-containing protein n=3 Tax=Janibacter melonis TaxID=262209 RepID=A0A5P8FM54_9MICO|nr:HNH endonuclease signature motif containing protein [Janibacter melonis]QFQ30689.2 DUF222 domain-containing protein [Janibacter melonis]
MIRPRPASPSSAPTPPAPPQAELGRTAAALDDGRISADHARVITGAMDDLPDGLTLEQRRACEAELLLLAVNRAPAKLRIAARRVLEAVEEDQDVVDAHEDDVLAAEEAHAHEESAFWIRDNHDGTMTGHFTVPWAAGAILGKVIDAMTAPRRRVQPGSDAVVTEPSDLARLTGDTRVDELDWQHRRGLAFADLLTRIPTDHLSRKVAATLLVTTRLDDLRGDLHRAGSTDAGDHLDAGTIRRMACAAGIIPVILGGPSQPLDLARQKRLFTEAQAVALSLRYDTCAAHGCERPFAWTEIHHLFAWRDGGLTDLLNAVPLCGYHHRMIDGPDWQHTTQRAPDDTVTIHFHRRT